ncbi:MAG: hypothetical protein LH613_01680 [Chamaesiphon sp.]|nr:hypothetical protein [Chamaesiphon sp.]
MTSGQSIATAKVNAIALPIENTQRHRQVRETAHRLTKIRLALIVIEC